MRRSGTVAGLVALVAFAVGSYATYQVTGGVGRPGGPDPQPILLRQAVESDPEAVLEQTPGAGGVLVLLRNDSMTPVDVADAAFSRTTAIPPLYIAPATVAPGAEVNVYVPLPGACDTRVVNLSDSVRPVWVLINAHRPGTPEQLVSVEISGQVADIVSTCRKQQNG